MKFLLTLASAAPLVLLTLTSVLTQRHDELSTPLSLSTLKFWTAYILRENLARGVHLLEQSTGGDLELDPNIAQATIYLQDALRYRRVDTYPLLKMAKCVVGQDPVAQLEEALQILSATAHRYIVCAIQVVLDAVLTQEMVMTDMTWDLANDLQDFDKHTLLLIARAPTTQTTPPRLVNTTDLSLRGIWGTIINGTRVTQRLLGAVLLNIPVTPESLSDQIYVGSFLYLERIEPLAWDKLTAQPDIAKQKNLVTFMREIIPLLHSAVSGESDFEITKLTHVPKPPKNLREFREVCASLARSLFFSEGRGKTKRMLGGLLKRTEDEDDVGVYFRLDDEIVPFQTIEDERKLIYLKENIQKTLRSDEPAMRLHPGGSPMYNPPKKPAKDAVKVNAEGKKEKKTTWLDVVMPTQLNSKGLSKEELEHYAQAVSDMDTIFRSRKKKTEGGEGSDEEEKILEERMMGGKKRNEDEGKENYLRISFPIEAGKETTYEEGKE